MECLSSLTTYSPPTYALTYLSAQLPRFANFFPHANQYPALWILPPKSLIPFSIVLFLCFHYCYFPTFSYSIIVHPILVLTNNIPVRNTSRLLSLSP